MASKAKSFKQFPLGPGARVKLNLEFEQSVTMPTEIELTGEGDPLMVTDQAWKSSWPAAQKRHLQGRRGTAIWILRTRAEPSRVVSSCMTTIRDALVKDGDGPRQTKAVIISNVSTTPFLWTLGIESIILDNLQQRIDKGEGVFEGVEFSVAYAKADGNLFTASRGWAVSPGKHDWLRIPVSGWDGNTTVGFVDDGPRDENNLLLASFCTLDISDCIDALAERGNGKAYVQIKPNDETLLWHFDRDEAYGSLLCPHAKRSSERNTRYKSKPDERPGRTRRGACIDMHEGRRHWLWWTHDFRSGWLMIERIHLSKTDTAVQKRALVRLLQYAVTEAWVLGLNEVVCWQPPQVMSDALSELVREMEGVIKIGNCVWRSRDDTVPLLRWKGGRHPKKLPLEMVDVEHYVVS